MQSNPRPTANPAEPNETDYLEEGIHWREVFGRVWRGSPQIVGLALVGFVLAAVFAFFNFNNQPIETSLRVGLAYPGFERNEYPDGSKFVADDLRAADIIQGAMVRLKLGDNPQLQSQLTNSLSISPLIPAAVQRMRDKQIASGQPTVPYQANEFTVSLVLPYDHPFSTRNRELFLTASVDAFREKFGRTYIALPTEFGNAFSAISNEDYFQYEIILNSEMDSIVIFLQNMLEKAKAFRSPTTKLSFSDLLKQAQIFRQVRVNQVLGYIYTSGVTANHETTLIKLNYYIGLLEKDDRVLKQQEEYIQSLLNQASSDKSHRYVMAAKEQGQGQVTPVVDPGLINSLIENDAYNFLVRKALDIGLRSRSAHAELAQILERRKRITELSASENRSDKADTVRVITAEIKSLRVDYDAFIDRLRQTNSDYANQEFADAVRVTQSPATQEMKRGIIKLAIIGGVAGLMLGIGLSLIGLTIDGRLRRA